MLSIRSLLGLTLACLAPNPAVAADDAPVSLDSPRMNDWAAAPRAPIVLSGRLLNVPPEKLAAVAASASLVTLRPVSQLKLPIAVQPDGTFRLELTPTFPRQQLWLSIKPWFYGEIDLSADLHLEIDAAKHARTTATELPGIDLRGADAALVSEVNRFVFAFQRTRRLTLDDELQKLAREPAAGDIAARLAWLAELRADYHALLAEFAPRAAGWFLRHEIDATYFEAVLRAAAAAKHSLAAEPVWHEIAAHPSYVVSNEQAGFYRALLTYLRMLHTPGRLTLADQLEAATAAVADAAPELQAEHARALAASRRPDHDPVALNAQVAPLRSAGLLSAVSVLANRLASADLARLPAAKREIASLFLLPRDAAEAHLGLADLQRLAREPWMRAYLSAESAGATARLDAINTTLAQTQPAAAPSTAPRAADPLGPPQATLPAGARLYSFPGLAGSDLLARLRAAFAGRALILDFWGPWCAPCLSDLPHSRRAQLALAGEAVEFIYLGSRTTAEPWRRSIAELDLGGTHILLDPKQVDELMGFFGLGGFPGYAFIDRSGRHHPGVIDHFKTTPVEKLQALLR